MSRCRICEEDSSQSWRCCSAALAVAVSAWSVQVFLPLRGDQDRSPRERTRSPLARARTERCGGFEFRLRGSSLAITFLSYLSDRVSDAVLDMREGLRSITIEPKRNGVAAPYPSKRRALGCVVSSRCKQ